MSRKNYYETSHKDFQRKSEDILKISPSTPSSNFLSSRRLTEYQSTPDYFSDVAIDSPLVKSKVISELTNNNNENGDSSMITVGVRVRPFTQRELIDNVKCIVSMDANETIVTSEKGDVSRFSYDYSFWSFDDSSGQYASQAFVYEALAQPLLDKVLQGYNACLFAYGQTGSGKSYSIMGHGKDVGVVPRFCEELFQKIQDKVSNDENVAFNVELSFFEIYNEKIHDLLGSFCGKDKTSKKPSLKVREHPVMGPFVDGLSSYMVKSFEDINTWLSVGNNRRATASTWMNDNSSRSHSVLTLVVTQTKTSFIEHSVHKHNIISKINLVDLAGSERQASAKTTGDRLREGACINKSLMALGKVISVLSEQASLYGKSKKVFISYRDSILTWLLRESLGGNSKTSMLATISPSSLNLEETLSTLRYARQARNIVNVARINEDNNARMIRSLQAEIEKLRNLNEGRGVGEDNCLTEIKLLKDELLKKELEMKEMTRSWQEKLKQSEECKREEQKQLQKFGVSSKVNPSLPCLVNLNEDPQLSGVLFYAIKEGVTRVGRMRDNCDLDIQLNGALMSDNHCEFKLEGGLVSMTTVKGSACYVNGNEIKSGTSVVLRDGDRIVLAGDQFFRFVNPFEEKPSTCSMLPKDFHFALQEFNAVQQARRLEAELAKEKEKHMEDIEALKAEKSRVQADMQEKLSANKQRTDLLLAEHEVELLKVKEMMSEEKPEKLLIRRLEEENEDLQRRLNLTKLSHETQEIPTKNYASNIVNFIEDAGKDVTDYLAKSCVPESHDVKQNLLLMLKEANNISSYLSKDLKFTIEPLANDELAIKVQKIHLKISTYWSPDKFKSKLIEMKDLYQARDMRGTGEDIVDEILFDPKDTWESENHLDITSTLSRNNVSQTSPHQDVISSSFYDCSLESLELSFSDSRVMAKPSGTNYSQLIQMSIQGFKDMCSDDSTADRLLYLCQKIHGSVGSLHLENQNPQQSDVHLMLLAHSFNSLQVLVSQWLLQLSSSCSEVITVSGSLLFDAINDLGYYIQFFIQGLENNISTLVEHFHKICECLSKICSLAGKLSLSCRLDCFCLRSVHLVETENTFSSKIVSTVLKKSFLGGCNEFVLHALKTANSVMNESKHRLSALNLSISPDNDELQELLKRTCRTISLTTSLLNKLEEVQLQFIDSSEEPFVKDFYLASFLRCKSLCMQFSSIIDCSLQLTEKIEWIISGETGHTVGLRVVLEALVEELCGLTDGTGSTSQYALETSQLSDFLNNSQLEILEMAVGEVKEAVKDLSYLASPNGV